MQAPKTIDEIFATKMTFPRRKYPIASSLVVTILKKSLQSLFETLTDKTGRTMSRKSMNKIRHF